MLVSADSLLSGLLAYQLTKLQVLQNTAASLISFTRKYDHITPVLKSLHWLPVNYQIIFKILLLVIKVLNTSVTWCHSISMMVSTTEPTQGHSGQPPPYAGGPQVNQIIW